MKKGVDYIGVGVGAVIIKDEKVLLAKRGAKAKNERGKWEIPGGGVEFGETFEEALEREIMEELGIRVRVGKLLHTYSHIIKDEGQHWVSPTYFCEIVEGEPMICEPGKCDEIGWFTLQEAENLPLSIITKQDIEKLKEML